MAGFASVALLAGALSGFAPSGAAMAAEASAEKSRAASTDLEIARVGGEAGAVDLIFMPGPGSPESWSTTVAKPDAVIPPLPVAFRAAVPEGVPAAARGSAAASGATSGVLLVVLAAATVAIALAGFLAWHALVTFRSWRSFSAYLGAAMAATLRRVRSISRGLPRAVAAVRPDNWAQSLRGARHALSAVYLRWVRSAFAGRLRRTGAAGFGFGSFSRRAQASDAPGQGGRRSRPRGLDTLEGLDDPMLAGGARAVERSYGSAYRAVSMLAEGSALRETLEGEIEAVKRRVGVAFMIAGGEDRGPEALKRRQGVLLRNAARDLDRIEKIARSASVDPSSSFGFGGGAAAGTGLVGRDGALAMPTTPAEAYIVLGVTASVPEGALKKVVDGLRMSWHPDLAVGETDRIAREDRIKQINIAWDLVKARHRGTGAMPGSATRSSGEGVPSSPEATQTAA